MRINLINCGTVVGGCTVFCVIGNCSYDIKNAPLWIALRRIGIMSLWRLAAGGEFCDTGFLFALSGKVTVS